MRGSRCGRLVGVVLWAAVASGCGGSGSGSESGAAAGAGVGEPPAELEGNSGRLRAPEGMTAAAPAADSGVVEAPGEATALAPEIGTLVLRKALAAGRELALLDVRTPGEYEVGHIEGALNVPVYELDDKLDEVREFQNGRELVVYCEVGGRTRKAAAMLQAAGFEHVVQYIPGMREWRQEE